MLLQLLEFETSWFPRVHDALLYKLGLKLQYWAVEITAEGAILRTAVMP
jgi:hypothetical protein